MGAAPKPQIERLTPAQRPTSGSPKAKPSRGIQRIFIDKTVIQKRTAIDWDNLVVRVQWNGDEEKYRYGLKRMRATKLEHMPLAISYKATLVAGETDDERAIKSRRRFTLRLPNLDKITEAREIDERIEYAMKVFQQEHELHARLHHSVKECLPEILSNDFDEKNSNGERCYLGAGNKDLRRRTGNSLCLEENNDSIVLQFPYIATEYVEGLSLRKWVTKARGIRSGEEFYGISDPREWFDIAAALLHSLAKLHRERAAHGFICPDTVIVPEHLYKSGRRIQSSDHCLKFINAAGSQPVVYFPAKKEEEHDTIFPIRRWYDPTENLYRLRDRSEHWDRYDLDEGSDYYSATDIFSVGVTLAFLATGRDDTVSPFDYAEPWRSPGWEIVKGCQVRSRYHVMKVKLLDMLEEAARKRGDSKRRTSTEIYADCLSRAEVVLHCARSQLDRRAQSTHHVLTLMESFQPPDEKGKTHRVESSWRSPLLTALRKAADNNSHFDSSGLDDLVEDLLGPTIPKSVSNLVRHRLAAVLERIHSLYDPANGRSLRVRGSRATIVDAFLGAMCALKEGDRCVALTTPDFWTTENFAPSSRTSSLLQVLRLRGVVIEWVIVLKPSQLYMPQIQKILGFRCADDQRILNLTDRKDKSKGKGEHKESWKDSYFYAYATDDQYEKVLRDKKSFVGLVDTESSDPEPRLKLLIAPDFDSRGGSLAALTFWVDPQRGKTLLADFNEFREISMPVRFFDRIL